VLPALFRRKRRLIITVDGITDIVTEGITTDITITTITIGTGLGSSASMGVRGIIAIGNRIIARTSLTIADVAK
jgi:homoserine kinase